MIADNNLQWLRLFFAAQVVVVHAMTHLGNANSSLIEHFPGVPAFFFVSGFLIYASYKNAPGKRYFENRFLRLFPALLVVTLGGAGVALIAHGWQDLIHNAPTYTVWFLAQITLGQAYNPVLFRDVGVGVINGSLWTLTTEIIFYICVPAIVWLEGRFRHTVLALTSLSFAVYVIGPAIWTSPFYRDKTIYDLIALTPIAWGWMFGFGILAEKHFDWIQRKLRYLPLAAVPLIAMMAVGEGVLFGSTGNRLGLFYFVCYVALITWFAFGTPVVRLKADLSYGAYIWHMPIINLLLVLAMPSAIPLTLFLTFAAASASWFLVERPALRLKKRSLLTEHEPLAAAN